MVQLPAAHGWENEAQLGRPYLFFRALLTLLREMVPTLGLIGAPVLLASALAVTFGAWEQISGTSTLFTLPIGIWELSLGVYLAVKGFKSVPAVDEEHALAA